MTKKHFKLIAEMIAGITDDSERRKQAIMIIPLLREMNPRFDSKRFLDACNVNDDAPRAAKQAKQGKTKQAAH